MLQQKFLDDLSLIQGHDIWQALKDGLAIGINGREIDHAASICVTEQTLS